MEWNGGQDTHPTRLQTEKFRYYFEKFGGNRLFPREWLQVKQASRKFSKELEPP
jgi:hypothetical protein